jgi:hypothetical protein
MANNERSFEYDEDFDEDDTADDGCNESQPTRNGVADPAEWDNDDDIDDGGVPLTSTELAEVRRDFLESVKDFPF